MGAVLKFCLVFIVLAGFAAGTPALGQSGGDAALAKKKLIARQKARQEVNKKLIVQQTQQRQLQLEQRLLLNQQNRIGQQQLRKQQIRGQTQQNRARTPETEEAKKRNELLGKQRSQTVESERRNQQPEVRRTIQTRQQEQDVRKETSALKRYHESLNRQLQREQQGRLEE